MENTAVTEIAGHVFMGGTLFKSLVTINAVNHGKTFNIAE